MILILTALLLDTSGRREPALRAETLGRTWIPQEVGSDRGLDFRVYLNQTLNRRELWHLAADGVWFLRVRDGVYVLAQEGARGIWETQPKERILWRADRWVRTRY